jgi:D-alanyl-D-alanine carboxypeptidase
VRPVLAGILSGGLMRLIALPLMLFALHSAPMAAATKQPLAPFHGSIRVLPAATRRAVEQAHLWHAGCPIPLSRLRLLTVGFVGFDRAAHTGSLVVNADAARSLETVFGRLYHLRFRIREMEPTSDAGDDTAAFECRDAVSSPCPGTPPTHSWSEHAYGEAIDVNPIENPYTGCGVTRVRQSIPYLNRSPHRPGMVTRQVVHAFASIGWGWGGSWSGTKDYMHFSVNGH